MSNLTSTPVKPVYDEAALMRVLQHIEAGDWPSDYPRPTRRPEYLGRHRPDERLGQVTR